MSPVPGIISEPIERDEAAWNQGLSAYHPSLGSVLGATAEDTITRSPSTTLFRAVQRATAEPQTIETEAGEFSLPGQDMLAAQDANEQYGIPGHLKFDGPTPSSVASQLHDLKRAELAREDVMQRSPGGLLQGAAELGTGLVSSALDPLNVAAGFIPVVGEARMVAWLARAGEGVAARAAVRTGAGAINAGVSQVPLVAATYGGAQAEQADYGAVDALVSLAMGTALGGGLHASIGALTDRFSRAAGIGERMAAAPIETREAALRSAVGQLAGDGQVQGIDAVLSAEGARIGRPITGDLARPFSGPDNEASAIHEFDPAELGTDAATFQFKAGGDEEGVTDRLAGVTQWDPVKAGLSIVYEDANGKRWIADGHQRLGLANRLADEYPEQPRPKLYGWLYRAADGVSPEEVRVIAAAKNIAEGTGSAVDAAKVLRDAPGLAKELPPRSELVRQARALTNLDDRAFGMVVNGLVPTQYAAIVGRLAPEGGLEQRALLDLLAKTQPENATEAEAIVRQGLAAGHVESRQMGLFGEETIATNLFLDRARVLDRAMKDLRSDKKLFAAIAREKTKLAAEGAAKVNKQASERKAEIDAQALQSIQTLATRTGALSDSLTAAARRGREERNYAAATRDFVAAIRAAVARGDFDGLAASGDRGGAVVADEGAGGAGRAADRGAADELKGSAAPEGEAVPNGSEGQPAKDGASEAGDKTPGAPRARDIEGDLFRNNPYPSDDETTAALARAVEATKGTADQRLDAILAGAEHDLAQLKAEGLVGADEPELTAAANEMQRASVLERVYQAGGACLARNA